MSGVDVAALIPAEFRALLAGRPPEPDVSGDDWLRSLPKLLRGALARWELAVDGPARHGVCALVVPVRCTDGTPAALKVAWPHAESRDEHLALRAWDGDGAVPLLAADPSRATLLLARLDADRDLSRLPVDEACEILGGLLRRLDRPALPRLARLSGWAQRVASFDSPAVTQVPRRLVQQARSTITGLLEDDVDGRLVHTDLHYENVLAVLPNSPAAEGDSRADDAPDPSGGEWLAIDPKPMAAEPAFAVWPALHNRWTEMGTEIAWGVHLRLGWICDAAGIDEDRARAWALVRTVDDALEAAERGDAATLTARIALAKALSQRW
ncbi:aminoglycoside phosphotransferase family protein [Mobilicoccus massiliensis]|uniref:aminoglycoside phosphotransferase family protein n=1 Tax=Mobilicoccus massiliensis TaxID=1522310 RepID=UPI00058E99F2|nr:aminoglycoside phosphotransferase family protein [Mobilicoccus massiliensis]